MSFAAKLQTLSGLGELKRRTQQFDELKNAARKRGVPAETFAYVDMP